MGLMRSTRDCSCDGPDGAPARSDSSLMAAFLDLESHGVEVVGELPSALPNLMLRRAGIVKRIGVSPTNEAAAR
jgi:hypothetical protein